MKIANWKITEEKAKELTRLLDAAAKAYGIEQYVAVNAGLLSLEIEKLEFVEEEKKNG